MATMASVSNTDRGSVGLNGISANASTSPSQIASTSGVTLEQTPAHSVKEEDEDAKLFASLVNGIQSGAVTTSEMPGPSAASNQETTDPTAAWANAISNLQNVTGGTFPSLDLMQPMSNNIPGLEDPSAFAQQPSIPNDAEMNIPPEPIAAYAKLEFPGFSYYIQTLDFTIGRRPAEFRRSQTSLQQHITGSSKSLGDVDVDLGPLKSISRFHVRIFYQDQPAPPQWATGHDPNFSGNIPDSNGNVRSRSSFDEDAMSPFAPQGRFVLQVLGRNGCCVDDVYVGKGAIVPLGKRTKIQIAERVFYFVLPPSHSLLMSMEDDEEDESIGSSAEEESEEEDVQEESSSGSLGGSSDEESESETLPASVKKKKLTLKKDAKAIPAGAGKGGKGKGKGVEMDDAMEEDEEEGGKQSNANRKRKRGEPTEDDDKVLKVGTPIGVEALTFNKKKKKSNNPSGVEGTPSTSPEFVAGKGKGGGKSAIVSAAMAKARADVEAIQAAAEAQAAAVAGLQTPSNIAGGDVSMTPFPQQGSTSVPATPASPVLDKNKKPLPPPGPGIKPDKSNMDLIREAMNGPLSVSRGGKMALQEIYEYLTSTYEWFRNNSRANGRDWHSAIRHAVGNARDMDRIPRKPHESGKGVFYAFSSSDAAKAARAEAEASATQSDNSNAATPTAPSSGIAGLPPSALNAGNISGPMAGIATPSNTTKTAATTPLPASAIAAAAQGNLDGTTGIPPGADQATDAAAQASTTGAATSSASPAPPSAIAPDGRVRIVVGKAPADALAQMASAPKPAITQSIEALFGGPPIVHHEGTLFLSPIVFGAMSAEEINDIGGKGAQQALATLQAQLVAHLQSKMAAGAASPPPPSSPSPNPRPPTGSASPGPGQVRPPLGNRPPQPGNAAQMNNVRPALARPAGASNGRPPIQSRPPIARPTGAIGSAAPSNVRPGATQPSAIGKPGAPMPVRPTGRPPLTNIARPTAAALARPGRPPLQPRPAVQGPSASISRPAGNANAGGTAIGQNRPPQGTAVSSASTARPLGTAATAARPALPRPGSGVPGSNVNARPAVSRPPLHNAQRPIGSTGPTTSGQNAGAPVRPSLARPVSGRPPLSARPRPALPGQQVGRPPSTTTSGATQSAPVRPSVSTSSVSGNGKPAPSSTIRPTGSAPTNARPATGPASGSAASGIASGSSPSVTATPSAAIAGSSQSDMAALLALLTGGKLDSSKLTPAQHELLQRAGRLAAEQQKAQQQKVAAAVIGGARSPSPIKQSAPVKSTQSPRPAGSATQGSPVRPPLTPKAPTPTPDNAQQSPSAVAPETGTESEPANAQPSATSNGENNEETAS
ncbi:uncharacterized protein FA14DRAFT_11773 [Meira miltonrushii]|uniref:Fork-head domain-containing protein n=1 Tax=Meira miltonrushii TaxID=1280837 RepID=A0A316VM98_9BASI|nr:uncharacterized protein FA14DRAFT_11773 [Meira miltonrushii]PWN37221.1 hypothetical protein FA14DRAFT_11773 [Meira miltonrushii]